MDSAAVVHMLQNEQHPNDALSILLRDCHELSRKFHFFVLTHVYREANKAADQLAELGHHAPSGTSILVEPPPILLPTF